MEKVNDSSSSSERVTIAYTESLVASDEESSETLSSMTTTSSSLETPTSQESATSVLAALENLRQTEEYFGYVPVTTDPGPKMNALQYFWEHSIFQLYSFMMTHLLAHTPEDPVEFLVDLVERCVNYRDGQDIRPPLVFEDSHIRSVYTALDPLDDGAITYRQYVNGMTTLGLTEFNLIPNEMDSRQEDVPKEVFLQEARRALIAQLERWLGSPSSKTTFKSEDIVALISYDNNDENVQHENNSNGQFHVKEDEFSAHEDTFIVGGKKQVSVTSAGSMIETTKTDNNKTLSFIKKPIPSDNKSSTYIFSKSATKSP